MPWWPAITASPAGSGRDLENFTSFVVDPELENLEEIKWSDGLMRKFNGEVRGRVMGYFDAQGSVSEKEAA